MGGHLSYFSGKLGVTTSETIIDPSLGAADSSPLLALCDRPSVWPDVGVKSSPIFSKSCPKCSQCRFYIRVRFFKIATKKLSIIWASFGKSFVAKNFQKSPNLVTLPTTHKLSTHIPLSLSLSQVRKQHFKKIVKIVDAASAAALSSNKNFSSRKISPECFKA